MMLEETENMAILGLDIGTTNCKLVAYSSAGHILAEATTGYTVYHPQSGFAELDPTEIMHAVTSVLRKIAPAIAGYGSLAMAISAQGEAFVLVDCDGVALSSAPVSVDMRGLNLIAEFNVRPEVCEALKAARQSLTSLTSLAKLLWFYQEKDEIVQKTAQVLCIGEYVMQQLGVSPSIDHSMASRMGLLDNVRLQWSQELMDLADLPIAIFPPIVPSGTAIGVVSADIARQFGLDQPIRLYAGGHDQVCAMLGAGVVAAGTGLYSIGTTEAIALVTDGIEDDAFFRKVFPYPHVISGRYVALMGNQSGGRLLSWFKDLRDFNQTEALFDGLPDLPSSVIMLPHFAGSGSVLADENALGIIAGLSFQTTPQELTHAILEGITMEQAQSLSQARDHGIEIERLRAVGGGSRSSQWMQIKADITGLPIDCMENPDTACTGAAMLAGLGSGALVSLSDAVAKFTRLGTTYRPRPEYTEIYREKLSLYHEIYLSQTTHQKKQTALAARIKTLSSRMKDTN